MGLRRSLRKLYKKPEQKIHIIQNFYNTVYDRSVLISYIINPFVEGSQIVHQNYITSHIIAEVFSELKYNVDIVLYNDESVDINYGNYSAIFGFGYNLERSFYTSDRSIPRIHFITGAHEELQNKMSLKAVRDFYSLSGMWLAKVALVSSDPCYYSLYESDFAVILAHGFVFEDYKRRFQKDVYSLNNNILGAFSDFKQKSIETRNNNFLFLSGNGQINKGLSIILQVAKRRPELNFYIVVYAINEDLQQYFKDILEACNVFVQINVRMDSIQMREIIEKCTYSIAPSYIDGLPGGTIEPMSAGLIPIVSKYCGFPKEKFIFEIDDLSPECLNETINKALELDDLSYSEYSKAVTNYAKKNYSKSSVKTELFKILNQKLLHNNFNDEK